LIRIIDDSTKTSIDRPTIKLIYATISDISIQPLWRKANFWYL